MRALADSLTLSRFFLAPLVLIIGWWGERTILLVLVAVGVATDILDGRIARMASHGNERGARLDSWADLAFLGATGAGALLAWPSMLTEAYISVWLLLVAWSGPIIYGWLKFGQLTSYHTFLSRLALATVLAGFLLFVMTGALWLWQIAVGILSLSAVDELLITWRLAEPRADIPHCLAWRTSNDSSALSVPR